MELSGLEHKITIHKFRKFFATKSVDNFVISFLKCGKSFIILTNYLARIKQYPITNYKIDAI